MASVSASLQICPEVPIVGPRSSPDDTLLQSLELEGKATQRRLAEHPIVEQDVRSIMCCSSHGSRRLTSRVVVQWDH